MKIVLIDGLASVGQRSLVFLEPTPQIDANALGVFNSLMCKDRSTDLKQLMMSFEYWIKGCDNMKNRHHGWDKNEHASAFNDVHVFKANKHRLLGYKCHPLAANPRHIACVLVRHYYKKAYQADIKELKLVVKIAGNTEVEKAVMHHFASSKRTP